MVKKGKKSFWASITEALSSDHIKNIIVFFLEKQAVKVVLKKLLITGGFKAWIITFVVKELIEEMDEHLIEPAFRKVGYVSDKLEGAKVYKRVNNAKNVEDWVDSTADI